MQRRAVVTTFGKRLRLHAALHHETVTTAQRKAVREIAFALKLPAPKSEVPVALYGATLHLETVAQLPALEGKVPVAPHGDALQREAVVIPPCGGLRAAALRLEAQERAVVLTNKEQLSAVRGPGKQSSLWTLSLLTMLWPLLPPTPQEPQFTPAM